MSLANVCLSNCIRLNNLNNSRPKIDKICICCAIAYGPPLGSPLTALRYVM